MVSEALIQEIRERADILEVVAEHVALKRSGKTFRGPCPLHGGEGPNFSVDPSRGIFKCFVCGEGGDVFTFLMKHLGLDFPGAIRSVAERVGVEIPEEGRAEDPHAYLREVVAFAHEWFVGRLRDPAVGRVARDYLAARGVGPEEAERFGLGFAPDAWRELRDAARARSIDDRDLLEAGLLATSDRAEEPYDRFRDRLIFSILDLRDRPIAFGGRSMAPADEHTPKYINSPETPIFHKSRTLYGLSWARHAIRREGRALVAEGYTDVVSLHAHGFRTAVAPLGTALTAEQAVLVARYGKKVVLLYDSDRAGLRATFRAADTLLAAGAHPLVATLPPGEDPDSLLRTEGPGAMSDILDDAVDVLERKLQILERQGYLESIEGRRRAVDGVLSTLRSVTDETLLDIYLARTAERTGVRRETLVHEVAKGRQVARRGRREGSPRPGRAVETASVTARDAATERSLVLLMLRDPALAERAASAGVEPVHFRDSRLQAIYVALRRSAAEDAATLPGALEGDAARLWEELSADATELVHPAEVFDETVRRLVHRDRIERLSEIDRELELADENQARDLLVEKERIARELRAAGVSLSFLRRYRETAASSG